MSIDLERLRLNYNNVCRFCLSGKDLVPLFVHSTINQVLIEAADVLLLKVDENDGLPNRVCLRCRKRMVDYAMFEATALKAYHTLQSVLNHLDDGEVGNDVEIGDEEPDANSNPDALPTLIDGNEKLEKEEIVEEDVSEQQIEDAGFYQEVSKTRKKKACPVCGKLVSQISKHMPVHTSKTKAFACEHCDKCFAQLASLRKHQNIHRNIRKYRCEQCEASFCDRSSLRYHLAKHRGVQGFACEFCDRRFFTSSQWKQHQSLAHRERTLRCDVCGKMFLLKHHLMEHVQLHTDGQPHACDVCGKAFKRERYLYVHKRLRHNTQGDTMSSRMAG